MSFIGDRYEYDLFIGYSHGAGLSDPESSEIDVSIRDWTRNVAAAVTRRLRIGLGVRGETTFTHYMDDREASAVRLEDEIERKAKASALMLIFMSPSYLKSEWSRREIGWFFEQAEEDSRGIEHCVLRMILDTPNDADLPWPAQLLDRAGNRATFGEPFFDRSTNNPIELDFGPREFRALTGPIDSLVAEIVVKLRKLKQQIEAARALAPPAAARRRIPATVYVQSYNDAERWGAARDELARGRNRGSRTNSRRCLRTCR